MSEIQNKQTGDNLPRRGPGRPKGSPNKVTIEFRETVRTLLEGNAENVSRWLTLVAEGDGSESAKPNPAKALEILSSLAEYATPKLSRVEGHITPGDTKSHEEWLRELK